MFMVTIRISTTRNRLRTISFKDQFTCVLMHEHQGKNRHIVVPLSQDMKTLKRSYKYQGTLTLTCVNRL